MSDTNKEILVIRLSSIGDILLSTPFIQQIKNTFSDSKITYVVKKEFSDLLKHNLHIDHLISFDTELGIAGLLNLAKELKARQFDYIYDLHNNIRSNRLTSVYNKKKVFRVSKNKIKRALLIKLRINLYREIKSVAEKYLLTGASTGIRDNGEKLQIFWDEETELSLNKLLVNNNLHKRSYLCLAPGSAHFTKMWPLEYASDLIKRFIKEDNLKIVILGGPSEENILSDVSGNEGVVNLAGKLNLLESSAVLKYSMGLLTNDSGLMHMAAAVDIPIVALFGSTVKEFGFFPYRAKATILENNDLWCRPCTHIGRKRCPLGHFNCMRKISVEQVYNEVRRKLLK